MEKSTLEKINRFTRREFTEDEVYTFSVILCDNDIDRDYERFSDDALEQLAEKFIGRTGIFDHNPKSSNQTARIFDTQVITDESRKTAYNAPYRYLKAQAYMVRTDSNAELIREIDGGIKKEVSISCSAAKRTCSVCGADITNGRCSHAKGKTYNGRVCHTILSNITDSYEWSFVAVPAQVNAGVTKHYSENGKFSTPADVSFVDEQLRRDIRRLAFFCGGKSAADIACISAQGMDTAQLVSLRKSFELQLSRSEKTRLQLCPDTDEEDNSNSFSMK